MARTNTSSVSAFGMKDRLGYMFGDFGNDFTFILSSMFMMKFYTDIMGLSAGVVGMLMMWTLVCFAHWSFSLIRKMEMGETIIHPLCGCASIVIQKNYLSVYNKVVQAIL